MKWKRKVITVDDLRRAIGAGLNIDDSERQPMASDRQEWVAAITELTNEERSLIMADLHAAMTYVAGK